MKHIFLAVATAAILSLAAAPAIAQEGKQIVHDAEFYVLKAQNGKKWAAEDKSIGQKLAAMRQSITPPY